MERPNRERRGRTEAKAGEPSKCDLANQEAPASPRQGAGVTKQEDKFPAGPEELALPPASPHSSLYPVRFKGGKCSAKPIRERVNLLPGSPSKLSRLLSKPAEAADDGSSANLRGL